MCGPNPRASNGGRIAVLFSPSSSSSAPEMYTLLFHNSSPGRTTAIFRGNDDKASRLIRECRRMDLRIEKYGILTSSTTDPKSIPPLHSFRLDPGKGAKLEFDLPTLDLDVSDTGIVGRQVTLLSEDRALGVGIVGYN